ncbi:hypothetical protein F5Y01DRAFT_321805 [Xylaria sp. FL0043]|nr:hypothetical protein F5Y01DRAFT_321805 [Xylaria sp. FL0043]
MSIVPSTGILRKLYENARTQDIEYSSSAFWQAYLQTQFYPGNNHAVVCEYAPGEESRRRIDITVLQYDSSNHTITRLILIEAKRPGGTAAEVERQARRGARIAMENEHLSGLYAITTIGTAFRTWVTDHQSPELSPLHGERPRGERAAYTDADSAEAFTLEADIQFIKGEDTPLRVAPTVPSQGHLLHQLTSSPSISGYATTSQQAITASVTPTYMHTTTPEQGHSMEPNPPDEDMDLDAAAGPSTSGASEVEQAVDQASDQSMGEQSSARMEYQDSAPGGDTKWIEVTLRRKTHMTRKDEILFTNAKSKTVNTTAEEWQKMKYDGKTVYVYQAKHHVYWSPKLP